MRVAGNQRIKNGVLELNRNAGSVVLDLYRRDDAVPCVSDREIGHRAAPQRDRALSVQRRRRVSDQVHECLHHLVAVETDQRQAGIVVAPDMQ